MGYGRTDGWTPVVQCWIPVQYGQSVSIRGLPALPMSKTRGLSTDWPILASYAGLTRIDHVWPCWTTVGYLAGYPSGSVPWPYTPGYTVDHRCHAVHLPDTPRTAAVTHSPRVPERGPATCGPCDAHLLYVVNVVHRSVRTAHLMPICNGVQWLTCRTPMVQCWIPASY